MIFKWNKLLQVGMTIVGCAGVVGTAVLSAKATTKAHCILLEKGESYSDLKTKAKATWQCYIPTAIAGGITVACIAGSTVIGFRTQAALLGAYMTTYERLKQWKTTTLCEVDGDTFCRIEHQVLDATESTYISGKDAFSSNDNSWIKGDGSNEQLFHDSLSDTWFKSKPINVIQAEYHTNRNMSLRGDAELAEYYSFLGLEMLARDDIYKNIAWLCNDEYMWVDYGHSIKQTSHGDEYIELTFEFEPHPWEYWDEYY